MAAIGTHRAQALIDAASAVGLTAADLGRISGWGEDHLEMMSGSDESRCENAIDDRRRQAPAAPRRARRSLVDREMEDAFGLTSPALARGECHYCGGPLNRRGHCDECL